MYKLYLINRETQGLEVFKNIQDLCTYLWGRFIPRYTLVVSTNDWDKVVEIDADLDSFEEELKCILRNYI